MSALHDIPAITRYQAQLGAQMSQHNWDRDVNDFANATQVQAAVTFQCSYLPISCASIKKI